jgi:cbb3-type cytochrome oxidase maturation protein
VEVLILLIAVSLAMAMGAVLFFAWTVRERTLEHGDRLALLPLEDDESTPPDRETEARMRAESSTSGRGRVAGASGTAPGQGRPGNAS